MKYLLTMVSCKKDPKKKLQAWVPHMSVIFSECQHCKARTDYGNERHDEHYDLYETIVVTKKGQSLEAAIEEATAQIKANRKDFTVAAFSDPAIAYTKRRTKGGKKEISSSRP